MKPRARIKEISRLKVEIAAARKAHGPVLANRKRLTGLMVEQLRSESRKKRKTTPRATILTRWFRNVREVFARAA